MQSFLSKNQCFVAVRKRKSKKTEVYFIKNGKEASIHGHYSDKAGAREGKAGRDEGRVSFKQKLPEMKEKAAEQTKANPVAENAKKKAQEIA